MWRLITCGCIIATFWLWCVILAAPSHQGMKIWNSASHNGRNERQGRRVTTISPSSGRSRRSNRVLCPDKKRECRIIRRPSEPCYVYLNCTVCFWGEPNCTRISEPPSPFCQVADCRTVPHPTPPHPPTPPTPTPPSPSPSPSPKPTPSPTPSRTKHVIGIVACVILGVLVLLITSYGSRKLYFRLVRWRNDANRRERRRIVEILREREEMELINFRRSLRNYEPIPPYIPEEDPDSIVYHVNQRDREVEELERNEAAEAERIRQEEQEPIVKINVAQASARMTRTWNQVRETSHSVRSQSSRIARQTADNVSKKAKSIFRQ